MAKRDLQSFVTSTDHDHRRVFYDGDVQTESPFPRAAYRPIRRRFRKRKISTFNVIIWLFGLAVAVVLYISNIIAVSHLSAEINVLEKRYQNLVNRNELLRAQLSRKSALERIGKIATEQLGLHHPEEQPVWLKVDEELIEQLESE